ncbi:hypothetical protein G6F22_012059 [Rhizopus arrhizus]|nr:hypothetical protein G6F22_012059 [Rhizopus arrhizus]
MAGVFVQRAGQRCGPRGVCAVAGGEPEPWRGVAAAERGAERHVACAAAGAVDRWRCAAAFAGGAAACAAPAAGEAGAGGRGVAAGRGRGGPLCALAISGGGLCDPHRRAPAGGLAGRQHHGAGCAQRGVVGGAAHAAGVGGRSDF